MRSIVGIDIHASQAQVLLLILADSPQIANDNLFPIEAYVNIRWKRCVTGIKLFLLGTEV